MVAGTEQAFSHNLQRLVKELGTSTKSEMTEAMQSSSISGVGAFLAGDDLVVAVALLALVDQSTHVARQCGIWACNTYQWK
jgi:hypothetical protein